MSQSVVSQKQQLSQVVSQKQCLFPSLSQGQGYGIVDLPNLQRFEFKTCSSRSMKLSMERKANVFLGYLKDNEVSFESFVAYSEIDMMKSIKNYFLWLPNSGKQTVKDLWQYHTSLNYVMSEYCQKSLVDLPDYLGLKKLIKSMMKPIAEQEHISKKNYFDFVIFNALRTDDACYLNKESQKKIMGVIGAAAGSNKDKKDDQKNLKSGSKKRKREFDEDDDDAAEQSCLKKRLLGYELNNCSGVTFNIYEK